MKRLLTAVELRSLIKESKTIVVPSGSILSPSAKDLAKELGIEITIEGTVPHFMAQQTKKQQDSLIVSNRGHEETEETQKEINTPEIAGRDNNEIKKIVVKVLGEYFKPPCTNPVLTHVRNEQVKIQAFDQAPPGQKIGLVDVVTSREGNLAAGFMTFERSSLPWTLTYDEMDLVIEGEFHLQMNNRLIKAGPGDVVYIPKNSNVIFSSPSFAKVFYVTYPANWSELSGT